MKKDTQKIAFIINPVSGDLDKSSIEEKIEEFDNNKNQSTSVHYTKKKGNRELVRKLISEKKPDTLVVAGGDGTVNLVASEIINKNIKLGIIPAGSANGLATELEIPINLNKNFQIIGKDDPVTIDAIRINDKYAFHVSDFGLNANVIKRFEEGDSRGMWGYTKHFFAEIFKVNSYEYILEFEDERIRTKASMIFIANATKFGTGAKINPMGKIDDGKFEIIIVRAYKTRTLARKIIRFLKGEIEHIKFIEIKSVKNAVIYNSKRRLFQVDGEIWGKPKKVELEIVPKAIKILK